MEKELLLVWIAGKPYVATPYEVKEAVFEHVHDLVDIWHRMRQEGAV